MHDAELAVDDALARALIEESFPELGTTALTLVRTAGTVNTIIRVGDDLVARFPLLPAEHADLEHEAEALTAFAAVCPVPTPRPRGVGAGTGAYPSAWSLQTWIPGDTARPEAHAGSASLAQDLATVILALRAVDPGDRVFDGQGRGGDLTEHDEWVATCLAKSGRLLDVPSASRLWASLRMLPPEGPLAMSHRDLIPFNLLVAGRDGETRLTGILDGGAFGAADRALDLVCAWHLFDSPVRRVLRNSIGSGDLEWRRGAAWAFVQAIGLGWYYEESNPDMSGLGLATLRRLLTDPELSARIG